MALMMLIRHGRTPGNSTDRFIGQYDERIDEAGARQASLLVPRLERFRPDRLISSDLQRCTQTIAPFVSASGMEVETDARLREVGDGEWTNRTQEELWAGWPDLMRRYFEGEDVPRPGGERWKDVRRRVLAALNDIASEKEPAERVVICTHAGPSLLFASWITGVALPGNIFMGPFSPPGNAAVTLADPHAPLMISWNETCHLKT